MMRFAGLVWALVVALCGTALPNASAFDATAEQEILSLLNHERTSRGLQPLAADSRLTATSRAHSALMGKYREIGHQFDHEKMVALRLGDTGLHFSRSGENVAVADDAQAVHEALMHSPGHRANILNAEFNTVGIGAVRDGDALYVTEDFALRAAELSVEEAEQTVAEQFNDLRAKSGAPQLSLVKYPALRQGACEMAHQDSLEASMFGAGGKHPVPNAKNIVAYTVIDVQKLPDTLLRLRMTPGGSLAVGVCYERSASYENPIYWVAVVIRSSRP